MNRRRQRGFEDEHSGRSYRARCAIRALGGWALVMMVGSCTGGTSSAADASGISDASRGDSGVADAGIADAASPDAQPVLPADLVSLTLSVGSPLEPAFVPAQLTYQASLQVHEFEVSVTPTALIPDATIYVGGIAVSSGEQSPPISMELGSNSLVVEVYTSGGAFRFYEVDITRGAELTYFKASNTGARDGFGTGVALSGNTLAVSSPDEEDNSTGTDSNSGSVYVFLRTAGVWGQETVLKASNAASFDRFGGALALDGDTLVVGATGEDSQATGVDGDGSDNAAPNSGAVYVYRRSAGVWTQEAYLKASNAEAGDGFGTSLSLAGDTLIVGAMGEGSIATGIGGDESNNDAAGSGAVYVFRRTAGTWAQEAYVKASNSETLDGFGLVVSLFGDHFAVGASGESSTAAGVGGDETNNDATGSGAVYVFRNTAGTWAQEAYIKASNSEASDLFGASIALTASTLAVGAREEDSNAIGPSGNESENSATGSGAVYVFERTAGTWAQQAYLKASNTDAFDHFGASVALEGESLAVGAFGEDSNAVGLGDGQLDNSVSAGGAVYGFQRSGGVWAQASYQKASNTEAFDGFGAVLSLSGGELAVSATGEDSFATGINGVQGNNSFTASGAVYLRQLP